MEPVSLFITLVVIGIFMLAIEVVIPGGVVGGMGFLSLLAACVMGFSAFGPQMGVISTLCIMLGSGILLALWIKYLPFTPVGRAITLNEKPKEGTPRPFDHKDLLEKTGSAETDLRPSGIARIEGKRVDVVADQDWIEKDSAITVVKVEGNRIVVRANS